MGESQAGGDLSWPPSLEKNKQAASEALTKAIQKNRSLQPEDKKMLRRIRNKIPGAKPAGESEQK